LVVTSDLLEGEHLVILAWRERQPSSLGLRVPRLRRQVALCGRLHGLQS
jgi:hypothetical protein